MKPLKTQRLILVLRDVPSIKIPRRTPKNPGCEFIVREQVVTVYYDADRPNQVPLDYVVIDGRKVISNTRTSTALIDAGIPKSQWHGIDKTGLKAFDNITFDDLVKNQLNKNYEGSVEKARK